MVDCTGPADEARRGPRKAAQRARRTPELSEPKDLIVEIGTEEIPASFMAGALAALGEGIEKRLRAAGLGYSAVRTMGTPRRLAVLVEALAPVQPDRKIQARGPNVKAAYDENGNPTKALAGFAASQGVAPGDLTTIKTPRGEYVYAEKVVKGERTERLLPAMLADTVSSLSFPKAMRWSAFEMSFARPVHWILALYGKEPVRFRFGHIESGSTTRGHRFHSPAKAVAVGEASRYVETLREASVIVDPAERLEIIEKGLEEEARAAGGRVLADRGLLEEVTNLVEYPVVVHGRFEEEFLALPKEVVVNAMREHQRYFSVVDDKGRLVAAFITVANTRASDMGVVRRGNERVLRARLSDAKFYYEQDLKVPLTERVEELRGVVFQSRLGTSYEKVMRFTALALYIGGKTGFCEGVAGDDPAAFLADDYRVRLAAAKDSPKEYAALILGRACVLSKADLVSGVVGEFPSLQGKMGSIYASASGEPAEVAAAIYEHYMPVGASGELPASVPGAIIGMADKLDTITGCFGVGLIPSGAQDPYGLRRQALGTVAVILDKGLRVAIDELVDKALDLLAEKLTRGRDEVRRDVLDFIRERLRNQLLGRGLSHDAVEAVLSTPWFDIVDAVKRINAIEGFKEHPACPSLVTAFKRVSNILKGRRIEGRGPDASLFETDHERRLFETGRRLAPVIEEHRRKGEYKALFEALASVKETIDAFFDHVMVMVDDERTRNNRLLLLHSIRSLYISVADLSRLVV
ncbi:MAG TPA: glycine--tRNA ligase subunit beta [Deltaproteobacteria bacterium]|nr:glycine--tRNA ligase subunit beta [Deltaproteobacteria bacterium]